MKGMLRWCSALVFFLVAAVGSLAQAQGYVSTDLFGYNGSIYRYATLADALAGTSPISGSPFAVPQRDLGLYMVDGNAAFGGPNANAAMFLSAWYLNGGSTPSNSNQGFIQQYDVEGGSVLSMHTSWLDPAMTTFGFSVTGGLGLPGCTGTGDCGRLWNAGSPAGSANTTAGIFHNYSVDFTAAGLAPAIYNATTGVYESNSNPTSVTGQISALFENTSTLDPGSNGFYRANLTIDMNSLYGRNSQSVFGSSTTVPEPSTYALVAVGLAMMSAVAKRRRRLT